jgi:predicted dehydrogenase
MGPVIAWLQVFEDHGSLLDSRMCDIVVVATPNMTHAQILLDILNHPKAHHILVEKPLCTTVEDCYNVIEAAQARPEVLVQVGLEYRYIPAVAKLIEQVKINSVGRVRMVSIREHRFPFLVKVNNWNRFNKNSGGTLVEKCCHFFDLMTLIADSMPVRVMASGGQDINHLNESYNGEVPDILDNAYVVVDYENGVRGMLDLCMFAEGSRNEQEICVVGTRGKVCISTSIATFSKDSEQVSETNLNFLILQNCPVQLLMLGMQKSNLSFYSSFEEQSISSLGRGRLLYQRALFDLGHGIVAEKEF